MSATQLEADVNRLAGDFSNGGCPDYPKYYHHVRDTPYVTTIGFPPAPSIHEMPVGEIRQKGKPEFMGGDGNHSANGQTSDGQNAIFYPKTNEYWTGLRAQRKHCLTALGRQLAKILLKA